MTFAATATPESAEVPTCPYCGAAWTARMLDELARHSSGACTCCVAMPGLDVVPQGTASAAATLPAHDLCCDGCGKPIYRAPTTRSSAP